ncbi:hypothetical protein F4819DRAFT_445429 [Hypoxylon fuscum]|nr:hypothetical protein F4819DRAFT_445429 [Hypoxylon fuscum]
MASSDQKTVLGRPKPPPPTAAGVVTTISADTPRPADRTSQFEFRGFDFFANRDFNEWKNASQAYFAPASSEKRQRLPSTWLGDATPPSTPRQSDAGWDTYQAPPSEQTLPREKRTLGLRKKQFWWLLGLAVLLLIVAVGVGVGVGVGRAASQSAGAGADAGAGIGSSSSSSAISGTSVPTATATSTTSPSGSSSATTTTTTTSLTSTPTGTSNGKIDCPVANGTTYQVPGSDKRFLRICGIDYSGDQAKDLRQVPTESVLDCMKNCAGTSGCTGCGWGYIEGEGDMGTQPTCWMKGDLKGPPHETDVNWAFAVLL